MKTLAYQELSVGDLCFEVYTQQNYLYLCVVISFTNKMVRVNKGFLREGLTPAVGNVYPKFLIKITEEQALEYMRTPENINHEFNQKKMERIMAFYNEIKDRKNG